MIEKYMLNSEIDVVWLTGFMIIDDLSFVLPHREISC